jgi:hypothetical protein
MRTYAICSQHWIILIGLGLVGMAIITLDFVGDLMLSLHALLRRGRCKSHLNLVQILYLKQFHSE